MLLVLLPFHGPSSLVGRSVCAASRYEELGDEQEAGKRGLQLKTSGELQGLVWSLLRSCLPKGAPNHNHHHT